MNKKIMIRDAIRWMRRIWRHVPTCMNIMISISNNEREGKEENHSSKRKKSWGWGLGQNAVLCIMYCCVCGNGCVVRSVCRDLRVIQSCIVIPRGVSVKLVLK